MTLANSSDCSWEIRIKIVMQHFSGEGRETRNSGLPDKN